MRRTIIATLAFLFLLTGCEVSDMDDKLKTLSERPDIDEMTTRAVKVEALKP